MGIYTELPSTLKEVDVIIAGGGTTACVVASRLAAADPALSVLVIESGRDNYGVPAVTHPLLWRENYKPDDQQRVHHHVARPENQLADRESVVTVGHTLGGGSSVNLMMYMRAQKCDFDSWGAPGWTSDELMPFIKKWEKYHGLGNPDDHGYDGPVQVSGGTYRSEVAEDDFIQAMKQLGYDEPPDLQDFHSTGVSRIMKYISPDGRRQDAAHTYLHPLLRDGRHPNLHVLVETQVVRVLFDGDRRACGVEFRPNPATQPSSAETTSNKATTRSVAAKKLVVLSCGTLGSPPILERSGVGDPAVLERASVPLVVAALPGVGHDFQDHTISLYPYQADLPPDSTADNVHDGSEAGIAALLASGDKRLGWNGIDASSKLRPTAAEVKALGPRFEAVWDRDFRDEPGKPLVSMLFHAGSLVHQAAEADAGEEQRVIGGRAKAAVGSQYFTIDVFSSYPYSRGHVHITGSSPDDPLDFKTGYLSDEDEFDLKTHVWGYKKQREVARRMKSQRGELALRVPSFAAGSVAAFPSVQEGDDAAAATTDKGEIRYEAPDEVVIEKWLRDNMSTCWHGLGTCKMAPREAMGVVDADLGVHGVRGLKVADLSIVPENVAVNTMSTALTVGEKAADIFIRELGLSGAA